jgi:hypothetical protein
MLRNAYHDGMKFSPQDCQQLGPLSARVVGIYPGPFVVRVHESRNAMVHGTPFRFFVSVDLKFRKIDALQDIGWSGVTKSEATRMAKSLAARLALASSLLESSEAFSRPGKEILVGRRKAELHKILAPYVAEFL